MVPMTNILVHWHPQSTTRILLCAHYDTLPYPLRDKENPQGTFIGANDNASGVAVLMELAHDIPALKTKYGIDFLLLDGEEFIFSERGRFFLGSEYFAREYVKARLPYHYRWGVLLDMIGDADLQILRGTQQPVVERDSPAGRADLGHGGAARRAGVRGQAEV